MSFRARLTSFFILIVIVPMAAVGFLVFRLIGDSQTGKADARAAGIASGRDERLPDATPARPASTRAPWPGTSSRRRCRRWSAA